MDVAQQNWMLRRGRNGSKSGKWIVELIGKPTNCWFHDLEFDSTEI